MKHMTKELSTRAGLKEMFGKAVESEKMLFFKDSLHHLVENVEKKYGLGEMYAAKEQNLKTEEIKSSENDNFTL